MRTPRALLVVAGVGLAALVLALASRRGGWTTYAGASPLAAIATAAMIVALATAAAVGRAPWLAAAAAVAVTLPIWAGTANSAPLQSLAQALAPVAVPLLLALTRRPAHGLLALAAAVAAVVVAARLFLHDPLLDLRCFATCLPSPFAVLDASGVVRVVDVTSALLFSLLALYAAGRARGRLRDAAGPALLAAGIGLRAAVLIADPAERATEPALQLAYILAAAGATTIAAVATAEATAAFLARRAVLRLARDLRADATRDDLQLALRHLTGDPGLTVLALDEAPPPGDVQSVRVGGREIARIAHRPEARRALERALGSSLRLALANAALQERLERRVARLRAIRERVVMLGDSARRGFERDLHDGAQQGVLAVLYELRLQAGKAAGTSLAAALDEAAGAAAAALEELRELAHGIHPAILAEAGLRAALRSLASNAPVPVELAATPPGRYSLAAEATVYRLVDEAVHNAAIHADPNRVVIAVVERAGALVTTVTDDGAGGAQARTAGGLAQLDDRVGVCGGSLEIRSRAGHGTVVEAIIPCA